VRERPARPVADLKSRCYMSQDQMRRLVITGLEGVRLLDKLRNLPNWTLKAGIEGTGRMRLVKDDIEVYLDERGHNVVYTVNVLPFDVEGDQEGAKRELIQLLQEIEAADLDGVQADLVFSERDLGKM
jgi:hypothetical protein